MNLLDLHIVMSDGNSPFHWQMLASLKGEPVNLYQIKDEAVNMAEAHYKGFGMGEAPYVGYVDDDDFIEPGSIQLLVEALVNNPEKVAAFSSLYRVNSEGEKPKLISPNVKWNLWNTLHMPGYPVHMVVYRRDVVEEVREHMLASPHYSDVILKGCAAMMGDFIEVPEAKYYWRKHKGQMTGKRDGLIEAVKYCKEIAFSCTRCRERMGLEKPTVSATSAGCKNCGSK